MYVQLDETSKRLAPPKFFRLGLHTKAVIHAMPFKAEPPRLCGPLGRGFSNGLTTSSTELFCRQMLLGHLIHPPSPHHAPTHPHPTQIRAHSLYGCEHIPYMDATNGLIWGLFAGVPRFSRNRVPQQTGGAFGFAGVLCFLEESEHPSKLATLSKHGCEHIPNMDASTSLILMRAHSLH